MKKLILAGIFVLGGSTFARADLDTPEFKKALETNEVYDVEGAEAFPMNGFVCYANNPYGQYFRAWGPTPGIGQRRAMNLCFSYSHLCRPDGCWRY